MNVSHIALPTILLLLFAEGVLLLSVALLYRQVRGMADSGAMQRRMAALYRFALEGSLPPPPRTAAGRQRMAESLFSLTRHLALLDASERERLGRRCSLTHHLLRRAERGGAIVTADALQLLSVIPLSEKRAWRIARLMPLDPIARLYRVVILICHTPDRVVELLRCVSPTLPHHLVPRLVARLEECRIVLPCRELLAADAPLPLLVALWVVARYELTEYESEVCALLDTPDIELRIAALSAMAALGASVDSRVVEATAAMTIAERRRVLRIFLREGYSARALQPLTEAEERICSPLSDYVGSRLSLRKRNLIKA